MNKTSSCLAAAAAMALVGCGVSEIDPNTETSKTAEQLTTPGSVMFTTATTFKGALAQFGGGSGVAFGDAECQRRAQAAGLPGQYRALMCDSSSDAVDRLASSITYPVVNVEGQVLKQSDLFDGAALEGTLLQDDGAARTSSWTGCTALGRLGRKTCRNWTYFLSSDRGVSGFDSSIYWLGNTGLGSVCNAYRSITCVQTGM
jgi:hypothetical protein